MSVSDKQLTQIESWLEGDHRYKLLDCEQTGILKLRGAMLKVWLACWMCENDEQESWLGIKGLEKITGLSNRAVIDARNDLKAIGALNETGHTANIKYENPLQGAYTVQVTTVDNPFKGEKGSEHPSLSDKSSLPSRKRREQSSHAKSSLPSEQCSHKGSSSCSGSCSSSGSTNNSPYASATMTDTPVVKDAAEASLPNDLETTTTATAKATTKPKAKTLASSVKWMSKYDSPKPVEFDTWSQSARAIWTEAHRLKPGMVPVSSGDSSVEPSGLSSPVPVERTPPNTPRPPTTGKAGDGKFHCPACEYANQYGYKVAAHIEENHPERGQQRFTIECPAGDDSCWWRCHWNKVNNDKAKRDDEVLAHLEKQHNPNSPDYDPMGMCPKCEKDYVQLNSHRCKEAVA